MNGDENANSDVPRILRIESYGEYSVSEFDGYDNDDLVPSPVGIKGQIGFRMSAYFLLFFVL